MGLGGVAIATLPSVIFPKLMFSDRLGGHCDDLLYASVFYVEWHLFQAIRRFESHKKANDTIFRFYDFSFFAVRGKRIDSP